MGLITYFSLNGLKGVIKNIKLHPGCKKTVLCLVDIGKAEIIIEDKGLKGL